MTYAGGNADFYDELENKLEGCVQLIKFEYSGHGKRYKEKLYSSMNELADDAFESLSQYISEDEEYGIIGYSMGTIAAVELLKKILDSNIKRPKRMFLAAHEPRTLSSLSGFDQDINEELVKQRTIAFGAVPKQLVNNSSFWRVYLPILRADYSIIGKYRFEELELSTNIPATIFYSETDTSLQEMESWKEYFTKECEFVQYDGNHFFIKSHTDEMATIIKNKLVRA